MAELGHLVKVVFFKLNKNSSFVEITQLDDFCYNAGILGSIRCEYHGVRWLLTSTQSKKIPKKEKHIDFTIRKVQ